MEILFNSYTEKLGNIVIMGYIIRMQADKTEGINSDCLHRTEKGINK